MQHTSYLPGYYHPKDLNGGLTGNSWSIQHNDITWNSDRGFYVSVPPFIVDQNLELAHQKEIIKQTILKHEAIFRYQVTELHRVYRRQRELMDEIRRRKLMEDHLHLQALESKPLVSQSRSEQKMHWPLVDLPSIEPSALCTEMFQGSSNSIADQIVQPGAFLFMGQNVSKEWEVSSSKSSASRKRMLDLELPAEANLDSEDEEQFVERPVQGPNIVKSELQPQYCSTVNFVNPGDSSISSSSPRRTFHLFDLNEPVQSDETGCPNSALESINVHEAIGEMDQDLSGKTLAECAIRKKEGGDASNLNSFDEVSSVESTPLPCNQTASSSLRIVDKSHDGIPDKSLVVSPRRNFNEIPIVVLALPCFSTNASLRKSSKSSAGKYSLTKKRMHLYKSGASSPNSGTSGSLMKYGDDDDTSGQTDAVKFSKFSDSMNSAKGLDLNCMPSAESSDDQFSTPTSNISHLTLPEGREREICEKYGSALESRRSTRLSTRSNNPVGPGNHCKALTTNTCINLSNTKEGPLSSCHSEATMTTVERDLEAPVSPENKECSPPREDSQDTLISTAVQWCKGAHMSGHAEPDRAAAEALFFISLSVVQQRTTTAIGEQSEASHDSLGWLADIATSLASNEAMNLKLRRGNMDNYGHQLKTGKQKEALCNTLHSRTRRCRSRIANKQRVLQTEVLPSGASVSLHQLNGDFLANAGLKLPANAALESGTGRKTQRRTNSRSRRRSDIGKRTTCSLLQSHCGNDKQCNTGRFWKSWGVTKGRQNDRRARCSISPLFS